MKDFEVVAYMKDAISSTDWNIRCDEIKRRCEGYPDFWYQSVIASGLMKRVSASWDEPDDGEIHIMVYRPK